MYYEGDSLLALLAYSDAEQGKESFDFLNSQINGAIDNRQHRFDTA